MMKRIGNTLAALIVLAGLAACSTESRKTTIHEPGVFKGEKDALLALKNQQQLIDRLKLIQTDR